VRVRKEEAVRVDKENQKRYFEKNPCIPFTPVSKILPSSPPYLLNPSCRSSSWKIHHAKFS